MSPAFPKGRERLKDEDARIKEKGSKDYRIGRVYRVLGYSSFTPPQLLPGAVS